MDLKEARLNRASRHPWELARLDVVTSLLTAHLDPCEFAQILDIGCGDAWLVEKLATRFPASRFLAVDHALREAELEAIRWRLRHTSIAAFQNLDEALPPQAGPINMVLLLDVLEHIPDDERFLADLQLRPGMTSETKLVVTVPAWQGLYCSHDRFLGHYRRYTAPMLCERLARNGFEVEQSGYFFGGLLAARFAQVLAERLQATPPAERGVGRKWAIPMVDAIVRAGLVLDFKLGAALRDWGFSPPGLSAFAIATAGENAKCRPGLHRDLKRALAAHKSDSFHEPLCQMGAE